MIDIITSIELDKQSFWLGFIAGAIFVWFIYRLRKYLPTAINFIKHKYHQSREGLTSNAEFRYRNEILYQFQRMHITSSMFSLDEIIIPPKLLAPTSLTNLENEPQADLIINLTIPYLPDWPEMAAKYKAPTLSLIEALSKGANIVIIGQPGSGRTVTLAYLASVLTRKEINDFELSNLLPIYIHAQEITQAELNNSPLNTIIDLTSKYLTDLKQQKLSSLFHSSFAQNQAILLIDGLDEVSASQYQTAHDFIRDVLKTYPKLRIIAASSPYNIAGLTQLGLVPISLASWDEEMSSAFIKTFSHQWIKVNQLNDRSEKDHIDTLIIQNWLKGFNYPQTPLEITLRIWSALSDDLLGPDLIENIETYIRRTSSENPDARTILEQLSIHMILGQKLIIDQEDIHSFVERQGKKRNKLLVGENKELELKIESTEQISKKEEPPRELRIHSLLQTWIHIGLLIPVGNQAYRFSHTTIPGYLAGSSITNRQDISYILDQNDWAGKMLSIAYYLHFNEGIENIIDIYIDWDHEDLLHNKILTAARWLKNGTTNSRWRQKLMRYLAIKLQSESITLESSGRFLSALAVTNDPHVSLLFRQFLSSEDANIRQLAALGCGLMRDTKSIAEITKLINDLIPAVSRAACLALVAIGDKNALETVATVLIQGSETVRRYAAEALANHMEEGHPALRDGSKMEDLLIRRAVVFGLARIHDVWAEDILVNLQLEDQQWLVRNAAIQALEDRKQSKSYIPSPAIPLTDTPWLINFASKLGVGVAPGKPAIDLLIRALRDGDEGVRLAALNYLRFNGFAEAIPSIVEIYQRSLGDVREAAFDTLWHLSASGFEINHQS